MNEHRLLTAEEMLEEIFSYMNRLYKEKDFNKSILLLTDLGRSLVNAERASFWYRDVDKEQYWTLAALGTDRITVDKGTGIVGVSIENNMTLRINNPYEDPRFNPSVDKKTGFVTRSILCVPVTNDSGDVIGAYQVINKMSEDGESGFTEQDVNRLAMAATFCGKTLEAHLLKEQNQIDQLTGLKNRRGFNCFYENIQNTNSNRCIIMCDIDHFKKVNDTYGHNTGDAVLMHVAAILKNYVGDMGEVVRWGGEEFITCLKDCSLAEAVELAELIRSRVQESTARSSRTATRRLSTLLPSTRTLRRRPRRFLMRFRATGLRIFRIRSISFSLRRQRTECFVSRIAGLTAQARSLRFSDVGVDATRTCNLSVFSTP